MTWLEDLEQAIGVERLYRQTPDVETAHALLEDAVSLSARVAAQVERRRWNGEPVTPRLIAELQARVAQLRKIVE